MERAVHEKHIRGSTYPLQVLSIGAGLTILVRFAYYMFSPYITSLNAEFPSGTLTPAIVYWNAQRDGIEIYVLYIAILLIVVTAILIAYLNPPYRWLQGSVIGSVLLLAIATCLPSAVAFTPPAPWLIPISQRLFAAISVGFVLLVCIGGRKATHRLPEILFVTGISAAACLIATESIGLGNTIYIFEPAHRIIQGFGIRDVYMQYEALTTLVAAIWLTIGFGIEYFHIFVQITYLSTILAIFLMSYRTFRSSSMCILLVLALIIVRVVGAPWEPWIYPQTSPLRLDLWIIILMLIAVRGPFNVSVPIILGILIIGNGAFGILWTLAWLQLVLIIASLSVADQGIRASFVSVNSYRLVCWGGVGLYLLFSTALYYYLFERNIEATSAYQIIGIGFIPMAESSFFWVFPPVFSAFAALLVAMRREAPPRYVATGFAVLLFTIANCVYFFGRSHELALNSITIPLIVTLFFFFDACDRWLAQRRFGLAVGGWRRKLAGIAAPLSAVGFVAAAVFACADRLWVTVPARVDNLLTFTIPVAKDLPREKARALIAEVTAKAPKDRTFELLTADQDLEYAVGEQARAITGFYNPASTWIFQRDVIAHAQQVLDHCRPLVLDSTFYKFVPAGLRNARKAIQLEAVGYVLVLPAESTTANC